MPSTFTTSSIHIMRKVRFYFILGSVALIVELFLVVWGYRIVTSLDLKPGELQQPRVSNKNNNNQNYGRLPDGSFNGYPVFYHDLTLDKTYHSRPYSSVQCVGENYQGDDFSWMHRSCHFRFLCFNVSSREFEVYARPDDETLGSISRRRPFIDFSASVIPPPRDPSGFHEKAFSETGDGVSLGSGTVRHPRYNDDANTNDYDKNRIRIVKESHNWFPTVVRSSPPERYYALEEDVVFVPFHSVFREKGGNPGKEYSVFWDDLFPIYTLLSMFQLTSKDTHKEPLLMRYVPLDQNKSRPHRIEGEMKDLVSYDETKLQRAMDNYRPIMMRHDHYDDEKRVRRQRRRKTNWTSQIDAILMPTAIPSSPTSVHKEIVPLRSGLVCAKDAVAGLGPHGIRYMNGRNNMDVFHNQGKGSLLWKFRNYCIDNLGLWKTSSSPPVIRGHPGKSDFASSAIRIIFSAPLFNVMYGIGDGTLLEKENKAVDFTSIETELRKYLISFENHRGQEVNDENMVVDSNNRRLMGTTRSQIEIKSHDFSNENGNITSRIKLMINTTVFVAACSDTTASAAIFLPRGASLIVLYSTDNDNQGVDGGKTSVAGGKATDEILTPKLSSICHNYKDLLDNLSHVVVHWLPLSTMYSQESRKALFDLIKHATKVQNRGRM